MGTDKQTNTKARDRLQNSTLWRLGPFDGQRYNIVTRVDNQLAHLIFFCVNVLVHLEPPDKGEFGTEHSNIVTKLNI